MPSQSPTLPASPAVASRPSSRRYKTCRTCGRQYRGYRCKNPNCPQAKTSKAKARARRRRNGGGGVPRNASRVLFTAPAASPLSLNTDFYRERAERADELDGLRANIARLRAEQAQWFQSHEAGETWPGYDLLFDLEDALAHFEIAQPGDLGEQLVQQEVEALKTKWDAELAERDRDRTDEHRVELERLGYRFESGNGGHVFTPDGMCLGGLTGAHLALQIERAWRFHRNIGERLYGSTTSEEAQP